MKVMSSTLAEWPLNLGDRCSLPAGGRAGSRNGLSERPEYSAAWGMWSPVSLRGSPRRVGLSGSRTSRTPFYCLHLIREVQIID